MIGIEPVTPTLVADSLLTATMNQKSSLRKVPQFVSGARTGNKITSRKLIAGVVNLPIILLFSGELAAQTPESTLRTGGQDATFMISLWWIGSFVLGLALAYGIWRTWGRTRADKQRTERATKELYTEEQRRERGK
jgi:protein-S-isoprenylcysteine O-methyltransferase Ste14